ncbi:MAG TPA: O-antigen ligase family protein, partial [Symbiobacteriaceae bacterium]|nr:O-antigen ligase family protein [Symbiobacteriaceae bacterium]
RLLAIFLPTSLIAGIIILSPGLEAGILSTFSALFDKDIRLIMTLTGRLPMWEAIWVVSRNNPWGAGFAAADRLITDLLASANIGWAATHAHNGYIAAWVGGGWPGVIILVVMLGSTWACTDHLNLPVRALARALLIFMLINNMTIVGIGGFANATWLLFMAVTLFPVRHYENSTAPQPLPATRWRGSGIRG